MNISAQSGEVIVGQGATSTLHWPRAKSVQIDIDLARNSIWRSDYAEIRVLSGGQAYDFTLDEFLQRLGIEQESGG